MNKSNNSLLTRSEVKFMILGSIVGVGVLSLPKDTAEIAHEDACIAVVIGGLYYLYLVLVAGYLSKRFPNDDILSLNKKYFGKLLGGIVNFIFFIYFIYLCTAVASGFVNIVRTFVEGFLFPYKVVLIMVLLAAYTSSKGIKVLGQISVAIFFITLLIFISPMQALKVATIRNIFPIGRSGIKAILEASKTTLFAYTGVETIFFIYPHAKEKKKFFIDSLTAVLLAMSIYVWVTFISIYYLGVDIAVKNYWPFLTVTESVTVSIVNNFRSIFMFLWTLSVLKVVCNNYFISIYILQGFVKKVEFKKLCYGGIPIVFSITLYFSNIIRRAKIVPMLSGVSFAFIVIAVTILAAVIFFKEGWKR